MNRRTMEYREIRYAVDDGIATLTLDRPEKLNPFTERMKDELLGVFDRADADDAVRVIVVTGAGRGFCAGADLSSGVATFDADAQDSLIRDAEQWRDSSGLIMSRIFDLIKPVIAAVNGPAIGSGATKAFLAMGRLDDCKAGLQAFFARRPAKFPLKPSTDMPEVYPWWRLRAFDP